MVARRKKSENPKEYLWLFGGRYIFLAMILFLAIRKCYKPPPDLYAVAKLIHQLWGQTLLGVGKETNSFGDIVTYFGTNPPEQRDRDQKFVVHRTAYPTIKSTFFKRGIYHVLFVFGPMVLL